MIEFRRSRSVAVEINGRRVRRDVEAAATLAEFLREDLGLTGTKVSCELQVCGACSVIVDGEPVSACSYLAVDADERAVATVEGLNVDGELAPLQRAFIDAFAFQCGFCTPGFLMMSSALLAAIPDANADQVREYLDGNLCRCTGYQPILEAVLASACADEPEGN